MLIALDIDNTTADYNTMILTIGHTQGTIPTTTTGYPTTYGMVEPGWFPTQQDFLTAHTELCTTGLLRALPLLEPHLNPFIECLHHQGHTVVLCTCRLLPHFTTALTRTIISDTEDWAHTHLPAADDIIIGKPGIKNNIHADLYVDDSPSELEQLSTHSRAVAIDRPYNQDYRGDRIELVEDLVTFA